MHESVIDVGGGKLSAGGPEISVVVEIGLDVPTTAGNESIAADIEFPLVNEKRRFEVFLNKERAMMSATCALHKGNNIFQAARDVNSVTTISILPWLNNPHAFLCISLLERL
jgi:hypothetical protein